MEIKATPNNLTNLISNLLIRLRNDQIENDSEIIKDLNSLVSYLDKISDISQSDEALYDKSFITSNEDLGALSNSISSYSSDRIEDFRKSIPIQLTELKNLEKIEIIKEHLRKVAGVILSFNSVSIHG